MRTDNLTAMVLLSLTGAAAATCPAQVATALLREGSPISMGGPNVNSLNNTGVNSIGGYA